MIYSKTNNLKEVFNVSKCCIGWHTNTLCDAVLYGIPIISLDEDCFAYDIASHSLTDPLLYPDRTTWLTKISWCQWTKHEIGQGKFWSVIEEYLYGN